MVEADNILVEKVKKGDNRAFELLMRKYQGRIASVISRTVSDPSRVQDLTQETFLKAYRALPTFRGDSAFYTWLFRIAVNTAKNHLMVADRGVLAHDLELDDADKVAPQLRDYNTPERQLLQDELLETLDAAIRDLPEMMRKVIELRDIQDKSYEEIAALLECPIGTVRSRIFRGRQEIMDRMKRYLTAGVRPHYKTENRESEP
ncbi:MAG: sigma-70 family RNA polymerase sigma factor [Magnetococcales bacterium]|nr:sigma-70 family RNA polymerase sigma factor [Magnetococcales bacterium]MBF0323413.1 sigma-70 family RNA polymerase sigma factor [Magnetococcales bacterium]